MPVFTLPSFYLGFTFFENFQNLENKLLIFHLINELIIII